MPNIKAKYFSGEVNIHYSNYALGGTRINLYGAKFHESLFCATVCLPDNNLPDKHVWMKGWGENEGLPEALEKAGIIQLLPKFVQAGFCLAQMAKIIDPSYSPLDSSQ